MKRLISFLVVLSMVLSTSATAFAQQKQDPHNIVGHYVEELVLMSEEELANLSSIEVASLFEEAFQVSSSHYSEDEMRLGLDGLSFGLKFQSAVDILNAAQAKNASSTYGAQPTTGGQYYSGKIGVAWTRDTSSGRSPLTLAEIFSGTYTLEVDFLTWDTVATILAASTSYNVFQDITESIVLGASEAALSAKICSILNLKGITEAIAALAISAVITMGWNWLRSLDRAAMLKCFEKMSHNQYMRVQFMWAADMVNRFYSTIPKTSVIPNPFPGFYSDWRIDKFGVYYGY